MSDINLDWNEIFHTVAETKSFTKASDILGQDKSTISRNIDLLEQQLNTKLFYRTNKGVTLTTDGRKYFDFIDKGLSYFKAGEKLVKANNDIDTGELTIGALSHISHFYLIDKIEKIKNDHPGLKIKILTGSSGKNLIELLENHKIDFALDSTTMDITNKDIQKEQLKVIDNYENSKETSFLIIDNIFISKVPLEIKKLKELETIKLILGINTTNTSQELMKLMEEHNVDIEPDLEIDITELKVDATKKGLGIAYVMRDAVKNEIENGELYEVKLPIELPSSSINLLYLKDQLTSVDKKFIKNYLKK